MAKGTERRASNSVSFGNKELFCFIYDCYLISLLPKSFIKEKQSFHGVDVKKSCIPRVIQYFIRMVSVFFLNI